jgi:hypothetical protein
MNGFHALNNALGTKSENNFLDALVKKAGYSTFDVSYSGSEIKNKSADVFFYADRDGIIRSWILNCWPI